MAYPRRATFKVTLTVPEGATKQSCREYILDAVATHRGSLRPPHAYGEDDPDPGDPLFSLDSSSIRVTNYRKSRHGKR